MSKDEFLNLLRKSSAHAYDFVKEYVLDQLAKDFKYTVILNASDDDPKLLL